MLTLSSRKEARYEAIVARGCLDHTTAQQFEQECRSLLEGSRKWVVLDFHELQYVSSDGLRAVLNLAKKIRGGGRQLLFTGITGVIRDMFHIAGFLEIFPIVEGMDPEEWLRRSHE